jgi:hypothetical protein
VDKSNGDEDQRNEHWQPCLMDVSSHNAEESIDKPQGGDGEPNGLAAHFFRSIAGRSIQITRDAGRKIGRGESSDSEMV